LLQIRTLEWQDISAIWARELWPSRSSAIRPTSSMCFLGGNDTEIHDRYQPWFCGLFIDDQLVGVNSCHLTKPREMRLRGIWIADAFRGQGLSRHLFEFVDGIAASQGCSRIWSYPRLSAWPFYARAGYRKVSETMPSDENGLHVYAAKEIA